MAPSRRSASRRATEGTSPHDEDPMPTNSDSASGPDMHASLPQQLRSLVRPLTEAAEYARDAWKASGKSYEEKRDGSRVTAVDRRLDRFLRRELEARDAEPVRSEEHRPEGPRGEMRDGWIVDPIDGTHPFTEGRDGFAVQVAHVASGRPDWAIMALPARRELYLAARDEGAWRLVEGGGEAVRLELSDDAEPVARLPFAPSDPERARLARALELEPAEFQRAIGPMIATLFRGASRLVVGRRNVLYDWDLAAPELIAREVGGSVTDLDGRRLRYGAPDPVHPGGVVATGPGFDHERALGVLADSSLGTSA